MLLLRSPQIGSAVPQQHRIAACVTPQRLDHVQGAGTLAGDVERTMKLPVCLAVSELVFHPIGVPANLGRHETLFRREMFDGGAQRGGFKVDPQFENLGGIGGRERHDEGARRGLMAIKPSNSRRCRASLSGTWLNPSSAARKCCCSLSPGPSSPLRMASRSRSVANVLAVMCDAALVSPLARLAIRAAVADCSIRGFRFAGFACRMSFIKAAPRRIESARIS